MTDIEWDFKIEDPIEFFDGRMSYEITGYRPIDGENGLDFTVEPFIQVRKTKLDTGHYCPYIPGSKLYRDFWMEEYKKCRDGVTYNGYTITGDHYFFLNYYQMDLADAKAQKAAGGRSRSFPSFMVKQYEYFHYIELCKILKKNAIGLKARGVGFSEIGAAIILNNYSCRKGFRTVITAHNEEQLNPTLNKCWDNMNYLDSETDDGFKKLRQTHNSYNWKRASVKTSDGIEQGWMSEIVGIIANNPKNVRGNRCDLLVFEEFGSWPDGFKAWVQGSALVGVMGIQFGIKMGWGTGGDSGEALAGLSKIFNDPKAFGCLPYRHNFVKDGSDVLTGFFVPSYTAVLHIQDDRGWTDPAKGMEHYNKERDGYASDPAGWLTFVAEYCYTPEEALALEGENNFNKTLLAQQMSDIKIHHKDKLEHVVENGTLEYVRPDASSRDIDSFDVRFHRDYGGKVRILEHPITYDGVVPQGLYVAGIDGIDLGQNDTSETYKDPSDFCVVIKKRVRGSDDPGYVAIYKDRPQRIEEAYKMALKLQQYYNCKAMMEATKVGYITFLKQLKLAEKYLMHKPQSAFPASAKIKRNNQYGTPATIAIIAHQLDLIATFVEDYAHTLWFEEQVNELLTYNYTNKRKFDIIAAMGMAELGDEDMYGVSPKVIKETMKKDFNFGYWVDNRGIRHFGKRPEENKVEIGDMIGKISRKFGDLYNENDARMLMWNKEWDKR